MLKRRFASNERTEDDSIAIVGAGFSGLAMAIELQTSGIESFTIYEAADEIGGTWRDNTYPGCTCDIPSHMYSFSWEPNPDWSRTFSPQPEILDYLKDVAEKYGLYEHIEFETEIRSARFDETDGRWTLETAGGERIEARSVVLGIGALSRPKVPDFEGLDDYEGAAFHSARWDHDFDVAGKRIGVIGTGASGIQIVPEVAEEAEHVTVFQRTPPWIVAKPDRDYSDWEKALFDKVPAVQWLYRKAMYWLLESRALGFVDSDRLSDFFEWVARRHIDDSIDDPELKERVTPDYTMGCKRILRSNDYYPALEEDHVELVDCAVDRFTSDGVVTGDGRRHELDGVVLATGFHVTDFLSHFEVVGLDDRELNDAWSGGAEAYYGTAVSGFPNLFIMLGPNTGLGHHSVVFMIEAQARLIRQAIEEIRSSEIAWIDVKSAVQRDFNDRLQSRMDDTVWKSGCESWYLEEDGKNTTIWPGYTAEYWWRTRTLEMEDFRVVHESERQTAPAPQ